MEFLCINLGLFLLGLAILTILNRRRCKKLYRARKIKRSRIGVTIPLYTEVRIGENGKSTKGSVSWVAENQIHVMTEYGTYVCHITNVRKKL